MQNRKKEIERTEDICDDYCNFGGYLETYCVRETDSHMLPEK